MAMLMSSPLVYNCIFKEGGDCILGGEDKPSLIIGAELLIGDDLTLIVLPLATNRGLVLIKVLFGL
jgi:hypothetical protein